MTATISVANLKGGVGKSTTCMILADGLAARGRKVLVVELDPQASLTFMYRGAAELAGIDRSGRNIGDVLFPDQVSPTTFVAALAPDVSKLHEIVQTRGRVDLLPASPRMRFDELGFETRFTHEDEPQRPGRLIAERLGRRLETVLGPYDVIILDCAPNFGALAQGALLLSDLVLMPTLADPVSTFGLRTFVRDGLKGTLGLRRTPRYVLVSRFIANEESRRTLSLLRKTYKVFEPPIPHAEAMVRASYAPATQEVRSLAQKYDAITQHVLALAASLEHVVSARLNALQE